MSEAADILANEAELNELVNTVFTSYDTDGSGLIDRNELKTAMQNMAHECGILLPSEEEINKLLTSLDCDRSGTIDKSEFKKFIIDALEALQ